MKTICTFRIPLNNIGGHKIIKEKLPFLLIFMQNSWENVDDHFSSVIIHNIMLLYSICTKKLAQKHRFFPFFEKVPPWLILWLFVQLKNAWGPKLCVSLALSPNPSVYNDIDIYSFEKSQDNVHSLQHIGENSWYHEATLKNCLSCDPSKTPNLVKYSNQLKRAHSQTSLKCISMIMLAFPLI